MNRLPNIVVREAEARNRFLIGGAIALLGLAVLLIPAEFINTPAHVLYFAQFPRPVVALGHLVAAALLVAPCYAKGFRRGMSVFGVDVVCLSWTAVALYPRTIGGTANVVSIVAWALLAVCTHRMCLPEGMRRYPEGP